MSSFYVFCVAADIFGASSITICLHLSLMFYYRPLVFCKTHFWWSQSWRVETWFPLSQVHSYPFHTFAPCPPNLLLHLTLLYHHCRAKRVAFCYRCISNTMAKVFYINKINRLKSNLSTNKLKLCVMIFLISFTCADGPCFLIYKCQTLNLEIRLMDGRPSPPYLTGV
jgi:hypothetical protein